LEVHDHAGVPASPGSRGRQDGHGPHLHHEWRAGGPAGDDHAHEGPGPVTSVSPIKRRSRSGPPFPYQEGSLLLRAQDGVLRFLRDAAFDDALGGYLDFLARRGVAAHPRLAVDENELPDPGDREAALRLLVPALPPAAATRP